MSNYKTAILKPTKENLIKASLSLKLGDLVGMPTETVYGLAANALDENAVQKIFTAKNRPQDNPLIVHVHKDYDLLQLVTNITPLGKKLLNAFTPGPITLVFKSNGKVSKSVSKGLDTVAIRIPSHKIAQEFLKQCNLPVAAPSANISGRMSATTAQAVKEELDGKLAFIIDGGTCNIGIESTVVDVTGDTPIILRPGKITKQQIMAVAHSVQEKTVYNPNDKVVSPGVKYRHYSPNVPVFICPHKNYNLAKKVYQQMVQQKLNPIILCLGTEKQYVKGLQAKTLGTSIASATKNLYQTVRDAEKTNGAIVILSVAQRGMGVALNNRISKMNSFECK